MSRCPKLLPCSNEPTTGLDPQNRANLWDQIRKLRDWGTTIFLTTHYLEEADELADRLGIMDRGQIVAKGTPRELKQQIAGDVIVINVKQVGGQIEKIRNSLVNQPFVSEVRVEREKLYLYVKDGTKVMPRIFEVLEVNDLAIDAISLLQPLLDDVFLKQTGRSLRDAGSGKEAQK